MSAKKRVVLLGATGSIGENPLNVIRHASDDLELIGIAGNSRSEELAGIAREFNVPHAALADESAYRESRNGGIFPPGCRLACGEEGLTELATLPDTDIVLIATSGTAALRPALAAINAGRQIALANKEILVLAGKFVTEAARRHHVRLLPVDSEHNALFQCLEGRQPEEVERLILTASGGAFIDWPPEDLNRVTPRDALAHPNWSMGPKITVDSATMANKGLEMIEAYWLFDVEPRQIDVVLHRQSIIHSLVQLIDGSILAQLSPPSMTFPIQYALMYPKRVPGIQRSLDFTRIQRLDIEPVSGERYPCLSLARQALEAGGIAPAIFNTANEIAVNAFLANSLAFLEIPKVIDRALERLENFEPQTLDDVLCLEEAVRRTASELIENKAWKKTS